MFRNLRYYRYEGDWPADEAGVSERLETAGFEPCGPLTERSSGFEAVLPDTGPSLARRVSGADLLKLRSQSRILPAAAVAEALELRLDDYRRRMGEEPSGRDKRRLKAETRDELLPQAMLKSDRILGYVDPKDRVIGIDSAGEPNAERFLRRLKAAFGDLSIRPLAFREPVDGLMKQVFLGGAPRQFILGRECRMQDAKDPGATVRWNDFDLTEPTIRRHVGDGMLLTHLAVEYDHVLSFVIDVRGVITKIRFVGVDDDREEDDAAARFDAEFALASGTLRNLLGDLKTLLGGYA